MHIKIGDIVEFDGLKGKVDHVASPRWVRVKVAIGQTFYVKTSEINNK